MTNPFTGEELKAPSKAAVSEHLLTVPMGFATMAAMCGWVAAAGFFDAGSPWQKLLLCVGTGLPLLSTQLGQMWHSQNIRNKVDIANGSPTPLVAELPKDGQS